MVDILLIGAIVVGALYLLYRALWQKGCYCPGCTGQLCPGKHKDANHSIMDDRFESLPGREKGGIDNTI